MMLNKFFVFKVTRRFNKHSQVSVVVVALNKKHAIKRAKKKLSKDKNLMPWVYGKGFNIKNVIVERSK